VTSTQLTPLWQTRRGRFGIDSVPVLVDALRYRVVQPCGGDKGRGATPLNEHTTAAEAFAEIDSAAMVRGAGRCGSVDRGMNAAKC
jgi:hypothetical protein